MIHKQPNMSPSSPTLAVFDFDHTLTDRDSLLPFLFYLQGYLQGVLSLILLTPYFIQYAIGKLPREKIKEKILHRFMGGKSFNEIKALGKKYVDQQLDCYLKPEAVKRLRWHQSQGDRCLLVSASLDFYLIPWAMKYGFEAVLASRLEVTPDGVITGNLAGKNCWGPEKKRRLLEYLGEEKPSSLYVYGDSLGDADILAIADHPFYRKFE